MSLAQRLASRLASRPARRLTSLGGGGGGTPAPAYDYLIEDDTGWDTVFANDDATLSGTVIALAPGNYTAKTLTDRAFTSEVRIVAQNPANKPVIDELTLDGVENATFEQLRIVSSTWANPGGQCVKFEGNNANLAFEECEFQGNYRGVVGSINVVDELPEYACIAADVSGGAISALEIRADYVGDLLANGTYDLDFSPAGGTGAIATFDVVDGYITGTTLTNGGTGYTTSSHRNRRAIWAGQRRMLDWMPWGFRNGSPVSLNGVRVENCTFDTLNSAYKAAGGNTGHVELIGNTFTRVYQDLMSIGLQHPVAPYPITIKWNFGSLPFSVAQWDAGDPHSDFIQVFADDVGGAGNVTTADWENIVVEGNVFIDGDCRGSVQGAIIADVPSNVSYSGLRFCYNFVASNVQGLGLALVNPKDCYVMNNAFVRYDPTNVLNATPVQARVPGIQDDPGGGYYAFGRSVVGHNIGEGFTTDGISLPEVNRAKYSNVSLGRNGSAIAYGDVFTNHTGSRATLAEVIAAYTPKAAYTGKGPFANTSLVNHLTRTVNLDLEPSYFYFPSQQDVTASTTATSDWSRVMGGPATRAISVSNGEYRIADDASGTNATSWTSSSGTITIGKFVQVRHTSGVAGSVVTSTVLTIGSDSATFSTVTEGVATFNSVDNQSTAYSRFAKTGLSDTGIRKVLLVIRLKPDVVVQNANWIAETSGSAQRLYFPTTTAWRYQAITSNRVQLRPSLTPTTNAITHFIAMDFTNVNAGEGAIWTTDSTILLNNTVGTGGTFDTRTTAGSGDDYGEAAFDASQLLGSLSNHIGLFAEGDGGGVIADGAIEFFWMDWGDASYTLPDITDPVVKAKFTADNIGANGNGPTGSQPKIYYTGNAAAWNDAGGLANLGSLTLPLIKQAGTYV